jgi:cation diffusion facilitator CzcD-associated flavoprotein CzcO
MGTHASVHRDFRQFAGKKVLVVGSGQSDSNRPRCCTKAAPKSKSLALSITNGVRTKAEVAGLPRQISAHLERRYILGTAKALLQELAATTLCV